MALEKVIAADLIEVVENGSVQVRTKTAILEDGKEISSKFHRHVVAPGDDYSAEEDRVKAICAATHTQSVVDAYKATLDRSEI
jgi:archaellum component FlaF (FlaF/FlaG flagellin family)